MNRSEVKIMSELARELRTYNAENRLWTAQDVADYAGIALASARKRIMCHPKFPAAVRVPLADGSKTHARYYPEDVKKFFRRFKATKTKARQRRTA